MAALGSVQRSRILAKQELEKYLDEVINLVQEASGYPYPEDSKEPPIRALAYGVAIGSLLGAKDRLLKARDRLPGFVKEDKEGDSYEGIRSN